MTKFQTIAKLRSFLASQDIKFEGIYQTYNLADGRTVKFVEITKTNTWGLRGEATEMVEVAA